LTVSIHLPNRKAMETVQKCNFIEEKRKSVSFRGLSSGITDRMKTARLGEKSYRRDQLCRFRANNPAAVKK